jgi:ketosteroid isomerase-like protein
LRINMFTVFTFGANMLGMTARGISMDALRAQEARFARAFADRDLSLARDLYVPDVVYVSPTVRLFGWPAQIDGIERTLEFIALTIQGCAEIDYQAVDYAITPDADAAFVLVRFDWTAGAERLRSNYVVIYRYRNGRIARQELYYDPSGALERLGAAS